MGGRIHIKRCLLRFGFDILRTSQLPMISQEQSNGNAPLGVLYSARIVSFSFSKRKLWGYEKDQRCPHLIILIMPFLIY